MIRGTTPTHIFNLPIDTKIIEDLRVTYEQAGKALVEKKLTDVTTDGKQIRLTLTQEETLLFRPGLHAHLQLKVLTTDKSVLANHVTEITVEEILNEEVFR